MPTYFFHIRDHGELIRDSDGVEFPDLESVRDECSGIIRAVLAEPQWRDELATNRDFVITDELDRTVLVVPFLQLAREGSSAGGRRSQIFEKAAARLQ